MIDSATAAEAFKASRQAQGLVSAGYITADDLPQLNKMADLALVLMDQWGLDPGKPDGWSFAWKPTATDLGGECDYRTRTLSFSAPLFAFWERRFCLDLIKHEIAHALTPGGNRPHPPAWRWKFLEMGGSGTVTWDQFGAPALPIEKQNRRRKNWRGTCAQGHGFERVQRPRAGTYRCRIDGTKVSWKPI